MDGNLEQHSDDKILIIANSRVARRSGFGNLYTAYNKRFPLGAAGCFN